MAIVKMKKLRVMAMADKQDILLRELQKLGCVEISEPDDKLADPVWSSLLKRGTSNLSETRTEITDVNAALAALKRYAHMKDGLFIQRIQSPVPYLPESYEFPSSCRHCRLQKLFY